jgi:hypothetical protein
MYNNKTIPNVRSQMVDALLKPENIDKYIKDSDIKRLTALLPDSIGSNVIMIF